MTAMIKDCQSLHNNVLNKHLASKSNGSLKHFNMLSQMFEILPLRTICDRLVKIYIENFVVITRVLHIPKDYNFERLRKTI